MPARIVVDGARLRQILVNLLGNAIKFTQQGEVLLSVSAEEGNGGGAWTLRFEVHDTGVGIPEEKLAKLFQAFSQGDTSTSRTHGGTGLGLAISRKLVEAMGGAIGAESAPGRGSMFWFTIRAPLGGPLHEGRTGAPRLRGGTVLVVDDNATNRRILAHQLESWGMRPVALASPVDALDRIRHRAVFDAAILDHDMPEMDGTVLAAEIHRLAPSLPLILLSSVGWRRGDVEARGAHFSALLTKPARPSQLFDALATAIGAGPEPAHGVPDEARGEPAALRILLVEDNEVNQRVALLMLKALGHAQVDVASNGREAVERVQAEPFDIVLMDIQMPEMDGFEATRRIRGTLPPGGQPRIVALTAHALEGERERCLAVGMDDYLTKPIVRAALADALARHRASGGGA